MRINLFQILSIIIIMTGITSAQEIVVPPINNDATTQIQAFLDAPGNSIIKLSNCVYRITSLTIPSGKTLTSDGSGFATIMPTITRETRELSFTATQLIFMTSYSTLSNLKFDGENQMLPYYALDTNGNRIKDANGNDVKNLASIVCIRSGASKMLNISNVAIKNFTGDGINFDHIGHPSFCQFVKPLPSLNSISPVLTETNQTYAFTNFENWKLNGTKEWVQSWNSNTNEWGASITDCQIDNCAGRGIEITNSSWIRVFRCRVSNTNLSSIHVWGAFSNSTTPWTKCASQLYFFDNNCKKSMQAGIECGGCIFVRYEDNFAEKHEDMGFDLEWCTQCYVTKNISNIGKNAGISLFYSCSDITINGNTIYNNYPAKFDSTNNWVCSGVWLTEKDGKFSNTGHSNISIENNSIYLLSGYSKRDIYVSNPSENTNVSNQNNIVKRIGGHQKPLALQPYFD